MSIADNCHVRLKILQDTAEGYCLTREVDARLPAQRRRREHVPKGMFQVQVRPGRVEGNGITHRGCGQRYRQHDIASEKSRTISSGSPRWRSHAMICVVFVALLLILAFLTVLGPRPERRPQKPRVLRLPVRWRVEEERRYLDEE